MEKPGIISRIVFGIFALAFAAALILAETATVVNPSKAWWLSVIGFCFVPLVLLCVVFFFIALFRRSRFAWLLGLALVIAFVFVGRTFRFSTPKDSSERGPSVMSYNVGLFANAASGASSRMELADSVAAYIRKVSPDVVCLQEFYLPNSVNEKRWLASRFPGYTADYYTLTGQNGTAGCVTLSRFPVVRKGKMPFEGSTNMALYTDIDTGGEVFRIYNCHLQSYNMSIPFIFSSVRSEEKMEENGRRFRKFILARGRQVDSLVAHMKECPVRSFAVGDFNDMPMSYTYSKLIKGRRDAFRMARRGFGGTFSALLRIMRIDYVLYPTGLDATSYTIDRVKYSDHYPLLVKFKHFQ